MELIWENGLILYGNLKMRFKFARGMAIVFDPFWEVPAEHPLKKNELVYFISDIPNVEGHCIVATYDGRIVPMVHPDDFREATEDEL